MSDHYVTKRAQEAAEDLQWATFEYEYIESRVGDGFIVIRDSGPAGTRFIRSLYAFEDALRTEQLVASGVAVDVSSLLDGAL